MTTKGYYVPVSVKKLYYIIVGSAKILTTILLISFKALTKCTTGVEENFFILIMKITKNITMFIHS